VLDKLKQKLPPIRLGKNKNVVLMGIAAAMISGAIIFSLWRSSQSYTVLFGSQEQIPTTQVVEVLGSESIPYRVNPDNGQILVAENQLGRARMALAAKGITAALPVGYELMDKETMLGSSQFMQNVRYKRSLEGELAQSVMALDAVEYARVHLGMSEASSFVITTKPDSSASVILRLKPRHQLTPEQVGAIIQLVSGSVPGMKASQVRVINQNGELLSEGYQNSNNGLSTLKSGPELARKLQLAVEKNVANLLNPIVGANNYRISVTTQLDLSNIEETLERYGADPRTLDENVNQESSSDERAMGIPGTLSNQPAAKNNAQSPSTMLNRSQSQRKFAYDRDIRHVRHPSYKLEKMTVAIVLNKAASALEQWTTPPLDELKRLAIDAAGINFDRGDSLTMNLITFTPQTEYEETPLPWWQEPAALRWAQMGGIGLIAFFFLWFGVRPLIQRVTREEQTSSTSVASPDQPQNLTPETTAAMGDAAPKINDEKVLADVLPKSSFQEEDDLPSPASGLETKISHMQMLAYSETDRVAEVIKQWINSNERTRAEPDTRES